MVAFTHSQQTTAESDWLRSPRIAGMLELCIDWAAIGKLVVVAAHPDDETLGAAGLIQRAAQHGVPVEVLVATLGEKSHPHSPTHTPGDLAAIRAAELRRALKLLAPDAVHRVLGLPDGGLHVLAQELKQEIAAAAARNSDRSLVVAPWSRDGHTDHDAAGSAASLAARSTDSLFLEYPIWLWHWGSPNRGQVPWPALRKLNLSTQEQRAKAAAISSHASQVLPLSAAAGDEALLSAALLSHFNRGFETFIDAAGQFAPRGTAQPGWLQTQFDAIHNAGAEPWDPDSWYEKRKRSLLLGALPRAHFQSVVELGCSTGALAAELAARSARLVGVDASAEAVKTATKRTAHAGNTAIRQALLPDEWPAGRFDLFVLSEIGYYFSATELRALVGHMAESALPNACLAACHWRHPISGWPLNGDDVHRLLCADGRLTPTGTYIEQDFLLDTFMVRGAT